MTDLLQRMIDDRTAERVLACIGSSERLGILLALIREPSTVAELVKTCGYTSTGQVYHHLKPLIAADLVTEDRKTAKGTYIVRPDKIPGILAIGKGICQLADASSDGSEWGAEIHGGATAVDDRYLVTPEESRKIIETFFESTDPPVLKAFPPKEKKKLVILRVVAGCFEKGRRYAEPEVTEILKAIHEDHATLRRYLIAYGFMERTTDCKEYWLK